VRSWTKPLPEKQFELLNQLLNVRSLRNSKRAQNRHLRPAPQPQSEQYDQTLQEDPPDAPALSRRRPNHACRSRSAVVSS
jgi:hypothetical protein